MNFKLWINEQRDERLLDECLKEMSKKEQVQLKSLVFELQNSKLKENELKQEAEKNKAQLDKVNPLPNSILFFVYLT